MASSQQTQHVMNGFRERIRRLQNKKKIRNRQLLGLFYDLYEIFMLMAEDARTADVMEEMFGMPPPGMAKMFKVTPEEFDKVVERDQAATQEKVRPHKPGQYL